MMMRTHRVIVRFVFFIGAIPWGVASAAQAAQTGIEGTVSVSPTRPGAQQPGVSSAARLPNAALQLSDGKGHVVAQGASDEQGRFTLQVPAGDYQIQASPLTSPFPRCKASSVRVDADRLTRVDIVCNSGIQ
ncbi:MAG: carboxypeptidase-like regulatory domain-containing protein [Gemmatimonadota bacterium]|nr:carboxypeptidase-like regulatory domain-containing protein [Gemmatimonadota bacterium]